MTLLQDSPDELAGGEPSRAAGGQRSDAAATERAKADATQAARAAYAGGTLGRTACRLARLAAIALVSLSVALASGCATGGAGAPSTVPVSTEDRPAAAHGSGEMPADGAGEDGADHVPSAPAAADGSVDLAKIPAYDGDPYVVVNGNEPAFSASEVAAAEDAGADAEEYSALDGLDRCGVAEAVVSPDTMPHEERGSIGMVKPSGWHTVRYDDLVDGKYLYNRCHLIGFQLTGENANERNLITGTRYMNVEGMLPFENEVADYVDDTGGRVLYRVTPVFEGDELVARGVHLEAKSVEDAGASVSFNVFCYNVQPGVAIDYRTGESWRAGDSSAELARDEAAWQGAAVSAAGAGTDEAADGAADEDASTYVLNVNTGVFHWPDCSSVSQMKPKNRRTVEGTRSDLIDQGYRPCANCNP